MQYAASQIVIQHILAKFDKMGERVIMMGLGARKLKDMVGKHFKFRNQYDIFSSGFLRKI